MKKKYQAILWDCDGVLIDSEVLACSCAAACYTELGYPITTESFVERFMGKGRKNILREIQEETGRDLSDGFLARISDLQRAAFERDLQATPGIRETLAAISLPMAVASGSEGQRLQHTLGLTDLLGYFDGHVYSSEFLPRGKPAPDIFLHAAEKLGVEPASCLVVEDGIHGIHAAKAAGMDVIVYTGASHMTPALQKTVVGLGANAYVDDIRRVVDYLPETALRDDGAQKRRA